MRNPNQLQIIGRKELFTNPFWFKTDVLDELEFPPLSEVIPFSLPSDNLYDSSIEPIQLTSLYA